MVKAEDINDSLLSIADKRHAQIMQRFFKTGPGEYGEGDQFIGLRNRQVRLVVKETWRNTPLEEAVRLVKSPFHEVRLCGLLIMVEKYLKAMKSNDYDTAKNIYATYLSLHQYINNWDLVDLTAIKIVGNHEVLLRIDSIGLGADDSQSLMDEWIMPGHTLWQQRIAMVSTWMLIRKGFPEIVFERASCLLDSHHDLLHKAAGWMLRETWKQGYKEDLRDFLRIHVKHMPAVMLRYTCEHMPLDERQLWYRQRALRDSADIM